MSVSKSKDFFDVVTKPLFDDIINQINVRKNKQIVLFQLPADIKWNYRIHVLKKLMTMFKKVTKIYCFDEGIRDEYKTKPYYYYSEIYSFYDFDKDRNGVYRTNLFGLVVPKSTFYNLSIEGEIDAATINSHL